MKGQRETIGRYMEMYLPFILAVAVGILYHSRIRPMAGDDIFFRQALEGKTLWGYLAERYETWTSRFVIEFLLVTIVKYPLLWKILDTLLFATLPMLLSKIFGGGRLMNWCGVGVVLIYPFHDMGSAGWITTTINYFWPLWGMFYVGMLLKKMLLQERISLPEFVVGVLSVLVASSHEQVAVILFVVFLLYGFYFWKSRIRAGDVWLSVALVSGNVISLLSILLCPGNAVRNQVSIADLPIFQEYHFKDKLYLGLLSVERVFVANADTVFFLVAVILAVVVYIKTNHYKKTLLSSLPLFILFGQTVLRTAYPGLSGIFVMPGQITSWSWTEISTWIPMIYLAVSVSSMLYALYQILGESWVAYCYVLILLGCGFGVGVILGFTATMYVSGERVYITLYFILLFVMMLCIKKMSVQIYEKLKQTGGKMVLTVLAVVCLVNIGFVVLSC